MREPDLHACHASLARNYSAVCGCRSEKPDRFPFLADGETPFAEKALVFAGSDVVFSASYDVLLSGKIESIALACDESPTWGEACGCSSGIRLRVTIPPFIPVTRSVSFETSIPNPLRDHVNSGGVV